jgi:glycosidase
MPQLYSGDEIAMPGGADPDNRRDFPDGFQGDAHSAFTKSGRTVQEKEVFAWTSGLLKLRSTHPALQTGIEQNLFADENVFVFVRSPDEAGCAPDHSPNSATDRLLIVVNKAAKSKVVELPMEETALAYRYHRPNRKGLVRSDSVGPEWNRSALQHVARCAGSSSATRFEAYTR